MLFFLVFLGIPLAVYLMFVVSPFAQSFYYSLTDWSGISPTMNFIGLENYQRILDDAVFWKSLRNNLVLLVVLPTITIVLAYRAGRDGHHRRQLPRGCAGCAPGRASTVSSASSPTPCRP